MTIPDDFGPVSSAEMERRQQQFDMKVSQNMDTLLDTGQSAKARRDAAIWLGESGEPRAIPALVRICEETDDTALRTAAEQSLGMFRAMEQALNGSEEEQEQVYELVESIVVHGQMGRRLAVPMRTLRIIMGGMVGSFLLFMLIGLLAGGSGGLADPTADLPTLAAEVVLAASPTAVDEAGLLRAYYDELSADATALLNLYNATTRGEVLNCQLELNAPPLFAAIDPALMPVAEQLNVVQVQLSGPIQTFRNACDTQIPIQPEDANIQANEVVGAQRTLSAAAELFNQQVSAGEGTPEAQLIPTATATQMPTITPTSTPDPAVVTQHRRALTFIIDDMTALRGKNTLLLRYWQDVQEAGRTGGCLEPLPEIPANYELPSQDVPQVPQELIDAIESVNLGLDLSRRSWGAFAEACRTGRLVDVVGNQLPSVELAQQAFQTASASLNDLP